MNSDEALHELATAHPLDLNTAAIDEVITQQAARIAELENALANTVRQARQQSQEARTQRAIVMGIGELVGCANDWEMVEAVRARLEQQRGGVVPDGWVPLTIEHEPGYPEDVAFGPQRMMDRLKKWLDRYFAMRLNQPGECVVVRRELLADLVSLDREKRIPAERHLYALLAQQSKETDHEN